jgi:hypothetical protein
MCGTTLGRLPQSASRSRALLLPLITVALLAVFLATVVGGSIWHNHDGNSQATCSICHLNHQPMESPLAENCAPTFGEVERQLVVEELCAPSGPTIRLTSPRAPPTV